MITVYSIVARATWCIEMQRDSLRMLTDPYRFIVVNNDHGQAASRINVFCGELGIQHITVGGPALGFPSYAHALGLNFAWEHAIQSGGLVAILDMDMFLTRPFSIRQRLEGHAMVAHAQPRGDTCYPWPGLFLANVDKLPDPQDMRFDLLPGMDTGAAVADYLAAHGMTFDALTQVHEGEFEVYEGAWVHYRGASDWEGRGDEYHTARQARLRDALKGRSHA